MTTANNFCETDACQAFLAARESVARMLGERFSEADLVTLDAALRQHIESLELETEGSQEFGMAELELEMARQLAYELTQSEVPVTLH